jgi:UDP-N-acetylmuramyl pentapeptide phosphotransferase/UDP-N-acetylglucosamine-1-phosphate transferase
MPCCAALAVVLIGPRFALFLIWIFSDWLSRAYDTFIWPFLGFLLLPWTTLAYMVAVNWLDGLDGLVGILVLAAGIVLDVSAWTGGLRSRR